MTSYIDDNSFLTSYIDLYYYLNLVNVNSCFKINDSPETGIYDVATWVNQDKDLDEEQEVRDEMIVLSNHMNMQSTSNFILKYSLFNNSGNIWMTNGYRRYTEFYDTDNKEFNSFFIDPLTTEGAERDSIILKGRQNDDSYLNQFKFKYSGRLSSYNNEGNLHDNYYYAKINNYQNMQEINKMGLKVTLNGISNFITKYASIPVVIFKQGQAAKNRRYAGDELNNELADDEEAYLSPSGYLYDRFLSGWYVVKDYTINYNSNGSFSQEVFLIRREWPTPYLGGNINQS